MNRRDFLTAAAAVAGMGATGLAQAPAQPPAQGREGDAAAAAADADVAVRPTCPLRNWRGSRS